MVIRLAVEICCVVITGCMMAIDWDVAVGTNVVICSEMLIGFMVFDCLVVGCVVVVDSVIAMFG